MLQQEKPDDYVIATGESHKLEEFVEAAFGCVGLNWREYVIIDPGLLRPTDITVGRANPEKAREHLKWQSTYKMPDVVRMMIAAELGRKGDFAFSGLHFAFEPSRVLRTANAKRKTQNAKRKTVNNVHLRN